MRRFVVTAVVALALAPAAAKADPFTYKAPGDLVMDSGQGRVDDKVYAPGIRFPIEQGPAFANSQVYSPGGASGPPGSQCDAVNYKYPWRDNYCEIRDWDMPLCPAGTGHQGQDIRPSTCQKDTHWVVAVVDGKITNVGDYSVYLTAADGTRYDYLHMSNVQVQVGDQVKKGQQIGKVSNVFGNTPTTIHLHFNIRQNVQGLGNVYVPPYMSLVKAYEQLLLPPNGAPEGTLEQADCDGLRGFAQDPDAKDQSISVDLAFDGKEGEPDAQIITIPADEHREDLCASLGSCEHGFATDLPVSLRDGKEHTVHAYGLDAAMGPSSELAKSPATFTCPLEVPEGVRRHVVDYASFLAWKFSAFWDVATLGDDALAKIPVGDDLPDAPLLVRSDDGSPEVWWVDGYYRRHVPSPEVAAAWRLDLKATETWTKADLEAIEKGTPLRPRPFLVKSAGPAVYLIDDPQGTISGAGGGGVGGGGVGGEGGAGLDDGGDLQGRVGCGCVTAGRAPLFDVGAGWLALAIGALGIRRRGRARR